MTNKAWGGRFSDGLDPRAADFTESLHVDKRLAEEDVRGSIAHVRMLASQGILSAEDAERLVNGLKQISMRLQSGEVKWDPGAEDIHMSIESLLTEEVGEVGRRLHTARSRNDQVATDMRLWTREACQCTIDRIDRLVATLVDRAEESIDVLVPGYTHLQRAQPVRLAHHLLAWCEMLERDRGRLLDAARRMNECPLGAGALTTTTFPIDREATAKALGFTRPMRNSMDAVSDRDFLIEAVSALASCAVHLSRMGEELVLWASQEFGFVEMSDAFATGSSMMPQKKNPDIAELVRGKTGRVIGNLVSLLVLMKGLPLAYNRDMQEDKTPAFDAFDTVDACLEVLEGVMESVKFREDRMHAALEEGHLLATELADYLTARGVPFRDAHGIVGKLVAQCTQTNRMLSELNLSELKAAHDAFEENAFRALDPEAAVERRNVFGGPARARVKEAIEVFRRELQSRGVPQKGA